MIHRGPARHRMIWLLSLTPPPSSESKKTVKERIEDFLTGEMGGGVGEEPNHTTGDLVLYKLFNMLSTEKSQLSVYGWNLYLPHRLWKLITDTSYFSQT